MGNFPRMEGIKKAKDVDPEAYVRVVSADQIAQLKIRAAQLLASKQSEKIKTEEDIDELTTIKTDIDKL